MFAPLDRECSCAKVRGQQDRTAAGGTPMALGAQGALEQLPALACRGVAVELGPASSLTVSWWTRGSLRS